MYCSSLRQHIEPLPLFHLDFAQTALQSTSLRVNQRLLPVSYITPTTMTISLLCLKNGRLGMSGKYAGRDDNNGNMHADRPKRQVDTATRSLVDVALVSPSKHPVYLLCAVFASHYPSYHFNDDIPSHMPVKEFFSKRFTVSLITMSCGHFQVATHPRGSSFVSYKTTLSPPLDDFVTTSLHSADVSGPRCMSAVQQFTHPQILSHTPASLSSSRPSRR